jgi:hypothetical protein
MGKAPLSRRRFLQLVASGAAAETLLPFCEPALRAEFAQSAPPGLPESEVHLKKRAARHAKAYGSGDFGEWATDANGLPCFRYTCNQTEDPIAATPVETAWRAPTDHTHQIGNDRILAAASNYGYLQVRQDEGGPKFLNDYHPESGFFGAGIGYLTDGEEILGTYYPGAGVGFERVFGMGYLRKQTIGKNFSVSQTLFAPFGTDCGDDPVLISEVVVASQSRRPANLYWVEYWGCQPYAFDYQAFVAGHDSQGRLDPDKVVAQRREAALGFGHRFERTPEGAGLVEFKTIAKTMAAEALADGWDFAATGAPAAAAPDPLCPWLETESGDPAPPSPELPPSTFLASLDDGPVRFLTNARSFFGARNVLRHIGPAGSESVPVPAELLRPAGIANLVPENATSANPTPDDLSATGPESALILVKPFTLDAGQSQTLRFLYGYLPEGFSAAALVAKYRAAAPTALAQSAAAWNEEGIRLAVDAESPAEAPVEASTETWIERETRWHSYYLRSSFTYDDCFREHIVSQGSVYQYCFGFQGAARDPLQHALPLVFGESRLAKEVLRYTLKSQGGDGALPWAITGHGSTVPTRWPPSDLDLWLLWLASEYVLATRDSAFLDERLTTYPSHPKDPFGGPLHTVREKLDRAYRHLVETVGTGKHGLLRGHSGDWNGNIYRQGVPKGSAEAIRRDSESVMNAAMAAYILDHYARMLRYSGDAAAAKQASEFAEQQRNAVRAQWSGRWFKRLWLGEGLSPNGGWLGGGEGQDARLWLDGQPWAMLGGCATPEQTKTLVQAIDELLRKPSKIGAKQVGRRVDWPGFMPGESDNGGVWATLDGPLIWALAAADPAIAHAMAYDEWKKNSRAVHAEVYPGVWYGAWSGPDLYCSSDSDHAGQTGCDWGLVDPADRRPTSIYRGLSWTAWPVMNPHRHAWPLYSAAKLVGIEFTEAGVDLAPRLPRPQYSFRSRRVGVEKTAKGYQGWYAPTKAGSWTIRLKLPAEEASFKNLTVNDVAQPPQNQAAQNNSDDAIEFTGASTPDKPLRWSLTSD